MKRFTIQFTFFIIGLICFLSCGHDSSNQSKNENEIDSIFAKIRMIDSLKNSGTYTHLESWDIGKIVDNGYKEYKSLADMHSVGVYVYKLTNKTDTLYFLSFDYTERSEYSSRNESKIVDLEELKYLYPALDDMKKHYGDESDHYERYLYLTKSEAFISLKHLINSNYWSLKFCSIDIEKDDLDSLKNLLQMAEKKVIEIKKSK